MNSAAPRGVLMTMTTLERHRFTMDHDIAREVWVATWIVRGTKLGCELSSVGFPMREARPIMRAHAMQSIRGRVLPDLV